MYKHAAFSVRRRLCSSISCTPRSRPFLQRTAVSPVPARAFRVSSVGLADRHKTYFQPGDPVPIPRTSSSENGASDGARPHQKTDKTSSSVPKYSRSFRIVVGVFSAIGAFGIFGTIYRLLGDEYGWAGHRDKSSIALDIQYDQAASGTTELFSLLLLNAMNPGTLYDAYRDTEIFTELPLRLLDGTVVTEDNATCVRIVDVRGHTRFLLLAVDTEEGVQTSDWPSVLLDGKVKSVPYSWVSQETPIQRWLLKMCEDLSKEEKAGITAMYFTRDTMGLGPVGGDEEGEPLFMQVWKYDMESETSYGNMAYGLKKVKTERLPLPDTDVVKAFSRIHAIRAAQAMLEDDYDDDDDENDHGDDRDEDDEEEDDDDDDEDIIEVTIDTDTNA